MLASIVQENSLIYPDGQEYYSPSEQYPEYPFSHVAIQTNTIYKAVRECLAQCNLDKDNYGKPNWNPFGEYVKKGSKVFLLCNFVYHKRANESLENFLGKCTHASIIRPLIDYIYIATGQNGIITFGNAPLQSCNWDQVLHDTGAISIINFFQKNKINVTAKDLRLKVTSSDIWGQKRVLKENDDSLASIVSLDTSSLLNELYKDDRKVRFRVSDYNPERTEKSHQLNHHNYTINNEILSSDVILSVPKLKTHEKVGITVGLKGFVGCVGHKDCLAHHRFGPPKIKGDEYPNGTPFQISLSRFHDFVNIKKNEYPKIISFILSFMDSTARRIFRKIFKRILAGAWYGNDTAWRMTVDLANIVHYADKKGKMSNKIQRKHLMFVDGVIGGEGSGPLSPTSISSKVIYFCDNIVWGDMIAGKLMGYNINKIPMIQNARKDSKFIDSKIEMQKKCFFNGLEINSDEIKPIIGRPFILPSGWKGYI